MISINFCWLLLFFFYLFIFMEGWYLYLVSKCLNCRYIYAFSTDLCCYEVHQLPESLLKSKLPKKKNPKKGVRLSRWHLCMQISYSHCGILYQQTITAKSTGNLKYRPFTKRTSFQMYLITKTVLEILRSVKYIENDLN